MAATDPAHGCEQCRRLNPKVLRQVGDTELNEFFDGKAKETYKDFECTECGARWRELTEWGLGGHGHFWTPLRSREVRIARQVLEDVLSDSGMPAGNVIEQIRTSLSRQERVVVVEPDGSEALLQLDADGNFKTTPIEG